MKPCRILIVEDEAIVAMDMEDRLGRLGYAIAGRSAKAEQALAMVERERPDLVLMDIRLQGERDGIAVAHAIRQQFQLPVIFITAYSEDATLDRAKLAEPYGYILKPFEDRELRSTIEITLYKHRAEQEILRLNRLYNLLSQVNQAIVRSSSREELLTTVCRLLVEHGGVDLAWIGRLDPATPRIEPVTSFAVRNTVLEQFEGLDCDRSKGAEQSFPSLLRGKPYICNECSDTGCCIVAARTPEESRCRSCGWFPLQLGGEIWGVLGLFTPHSGFFLQPETDLLQEVAADLSFALDKIAGDAHRKQAEEALHESNERLKALFERARDAIFITDPDTNIILEANAAAENLLGLSRAEIIGLHCSQFHSSPAADTPRNESSTQYALSSNPSPLEAELQRADGSRVPVEISAGLVELDGGRQVTQSLVRDISERKQAERERNRMEAQLRQAQKMEALGTLAGGIAHDFNNILGIIIGYTDMAYWETPPQSPIHRQLEQVLKAADRAKELVRQILAFSRRSEHERSCVEVGLIVKEVMKMLRASLPTTIEIKTEVTSKGQIMADPSQIHQLLMNLCTNAAHAMRERSGVLAVTLTDVHIAPEAIAPHSERQPGPHLQLTVEDTGQGMESSVLDRIFDPFFTTKEPGVGTGLGLAVVHGIVTSLNGAIEVSSTPGQGTTFQVLLPARQAAAVTEKEQAAGLAGGREHILLVEDERQLAIIAKQMLERLGYAVEYQTDGIEALQNFHRQMLQNPFDLVITDMTMPRLTGLELASRLHRLQPDLPIILCTGFSEMVSSEQARSLGIQGLLMKPFTWEQLAELIREVLSEVPSPESDATGQQ